MGRSLFERVSDLERDSHPPIDLTPLVEHVLNERGYLPPPLIAVLLGEPTEDMLNAAQERLCQISSRTNFNDFEQAELFKAMVRAALTPQEKDQGR